MLCLLRSHPRAPSESPAQVCWGKSFGLRYLCWVLGWVSGCQAPITLLGSPSLVTLSCAGDSDLLVALLRRWRKFVVVCWGRQPRHRDSRSPLRLSDVQGDIQSCSFAAGITSSIAGDLIDQAVDGVCHGPTPVTWMRARGLCTYTQTVANISDHRLDFSQEIRCRIMRDGHCPGFA